MRRLVAFAGLSLSLVSGAWPALAQPTAPAQAAALPPKVLIFFALNVEADHMLFASDALRFFAETGDKQDFRVEATTNWADMNEENLKQYNCMIWLDGTPPEPYRKAFEQYMERGGGWLGFHVSGYNDRGTRWDWFRQFLGGSAFGVNSWPPLPAKVVVEDSASAITHGLPKTFVAPANEWYAWRPSPRLDRDVHVLASLDPAQLPLEIKGLITEEDSDLPVVWTNTKYRMLYMNMGHGDKIFSDPTQNTLVENGIGWLLKDRSLAFAAQ